MINVIDKADTRDSLFLEVGNDLVGAEVGVFRGDFSKVITLNAKPKYLYSVDIWYPVFTDYKELYDSNEVCYKNMREALVRLRPFIRDGRVRPLVGPSARVSEFIENKSLDFVYIDADHTYEGCLGDLRAWGPKVKPGGMISGHDICRQEYGVTEAVNEYMDEIGVDKGSLRITDERWKSYWFYKQEGASA